MSCSFHDVLAACAMACRTEGVTWSVVEPQRWPRTSARAASMVVRAAVTSLLSLGSGYGASASSERRRSSAIEARSWFVWSRSCQASI